MNTHRLLKQCKAIAARQKAPLISIPESIAITKEVTPMTANELEVYLTQVLQTARDAQRRFEEATALEMLPNESIQDILHAAEFAPSTLANVNIGEVLHGLRAARRTTKKELEVTSLFNDWSKENKASINKLEETLGKIRKVLKRQPHDFYMWKTNTIGEKGTPLIADEIPTERNESDEVK